MTQIIVTRALFKPLAPRYIYRIGFSNNDNADFLEGNWWICKAMWINTNYSNCFIFNNLSFIIICPPYLRTAMRFFVSNILCLGYTKFYKKQNIEISRIMKNFPFFLFVAERKNIMLIKMLNQRSHFSFSLFKFFLPKI